MCGEFFKVLRSLALTSAVIFALAFLAAGTVTVRQRAERNISGEKYAMAAFVRDEKNVGISAGGRRFTVDFDLIRERLSTFPRLYGHN